MRFDLLIRGGEVVDPATERSGRLDVAVTAGRIAAVKPDLPSASARRVIDATGTFVTPGLIDLHTHVFWGANYFGIDADSLAWNSGVTTWVDAGSAGAFSMLGFREYVIRPAQVRILAFIHGSYMGLAGLNYDEYCNMAACNAPLLREVVDGHRDIVRGIKVRMGKEGVCFRGLEPLQRAREAAELTGLPIMAHISGLPPSLEEILGLLKEGDIVTHAYTGGGEQPVDAEGHLLDCAREARQRGIAFDIGHGAGSFSFTTAEALAAAGFWPDSISTDLHQMSLHGHRMVEQEAHDFITSVRGDGTPQLYLTTVMSKLLYLGMPWPEVVRATTATPARLLGLAGEIGTLRPGAVADVATFMIDEGPQEFQDVYGNRRTGHQLVRNVQTWRAGRLMTPKAVPPPPPWIELLPEP
ncbi:MAG: amidohydrolase/deacetylase family metallohydrolase [Candidatus Limnocylindrales bacterium]